MVQVDVFWSYGIGAGYALAAAHQLEAARRDPLAGRVPPLADPHLTTVLVYAAAVFAPSGAWLLWQFTSWETMHAGSAGTVPAWLVALFTATNTTQALVGFLVTRALLSRGRTRLACAQVVLAYFGMFFLLVHGWDGTGYQRFFSPTAADFARWSAGDPMGHVRGWLGSDVAVTLYAMGVVLLPLLLGGYFRWHLAGLRAAGDRTPTARIGLRFAAITLGGIVGLGLGGAIGASVLLRLLGAVPGTAVAALVGLAVAVPRRGPLGLAAGHLVPPRPGAAAAPAGAVSPR